MNKFENIIQGDKPVLVDFSAEWCGPCKALAPILKQLKSKTGDALTILKVDVDANRALSARLNISGVPTLILYRKGKQLWRQSGVIPLDQLEKIIKQYQ